jgi:hypothetical protein
VEKLMCVLREKCEVKFLRYEWTFSATGKRGVSGGKGRAPYAMTGCGILVVRES